jgi:ribose 5-phosphate isomerase B
MKIAIAADHAGFLLKEKLRDDLQAKGHDVADLGTTSEESTDYPDYAAAVAHSVADGRFERGILVCSTGVGMSIAANKVAGVRAALGTNEEEVHLTREHNDANVLTLGARFFTAEQAGKLIDVFLATPFSEGARHVRRLSKISALEDEAQNCGQVDRQLERQRVGAIKS